MTAKPLTKFIAESGYCSRRQAEELIRQGQVKVNKETAVLGLKVFDNDEVCIGEKRITVDFKKIYIILNKPEGYVCTNRKFKGEKNVFDLLLEKKGKELQLKHRLFVVGRLDKNSHGLVLITNDGELTYRATHPKFQHEKEYCVKISNFPSNSASLAESRRAGRQFPISNKIPDDIIYKFKKGVRINGGEAKVKDIKYLGKGCFTIILTQGMKRQIREMFKALDFEVSDIKRTRINLGQSDLDLGDLKKGKWRCLSEQEIAQINR